MINNCLDVLQTRVAQNDSIACNLLKNIDRYEQFAIMYSLDSSLLNRIFNTAIMNEHYEICQVITELLEEREMMENCALGSSLARSE